MSNERYEDDQPEPAETQPEPDFDKPPPDVTYILDHKLPEEERGNEVLNERKSD